MHPIARRAIAGESIETLVDEFYSSSGPLAEAGWEIRQSQREMALAFARQIDGSGVDGGGETDADDDEEPESSVVLHGGSIGLIEAATGTGKGAAYLIPGFLGALRAEGAYRGPAINVRFHPKKLIVSTANIALQAQLIRKDIPALGRMLGVDPRAVLMKSRANYVCREKIQIEAGSMLGRQDQALQEVWSWSQRPGCDGDRESYPGDVAEVWHKVSVGSDECGRQSCPHYDADSGLPLCFWRQATMAWPKAHIIVGNHHWVALSKGIKTLAYVVDEAHELENALRSVQGRTLTTSTFLTLARRAEKVLGEGQIEAMVAKAALALFSVIERVVDDRLQGVSETHPQFRSPVPLEQDWCPASARPQILDGFKVIRDLRDRVAKKALDLPYNTFMEGEIRTITKEKTDKAKASRSAAMLTNKLAELCRIFGAAALGRAHPDWPSNTSPWAIWAHRERDGRDQWRLVVELVPADVAPAFAALHQANPTMLLTSATLPEFTSMRLSLGLGARWVGDAVPSWPVNLSTHTGLWAHKVEIRTERHPEPDRESDLLDDPDLLDDEPQSNRMATSQTLAPEPDFERRLPSPYPLADMGVLVIPDGPAPKDSNWPEWATCRVVEAVRQSNGGALVLATSNAAMSRYTAALREVGHWNVIRQGEQGRARTIQAFKEDEDSVLVATRSFFQGLDVQGRSCRLVVIDRIPFGSPEDPLETAVGKLLVERALALDPHAAGASPWMLRSIPEASMVLVQGVGRLIRSQDDRGAVVLLDNRILYSGQGWKTLLTGLPPFPLSRSMVDIGRVLAGFRVQSSIYQSRPKAARELTF